MGSNWLFGSGLDVATAWTEFGLAWLVQSTAIVILGMLAAAIVRRRHPAVLSVVYQTTLVAVLAAPLVAYALASSGLTFVSLALPEARYESQELVEVLVAAEEPPVEVAATAPTPSPRFDNLDRLEDEIQETSNPSSEPMFSIDSGLPVEQPSFGPSHSPQPEVAVSPPAPSVPPAPAEPIVRRVLQRVTRTHWLLAAIWFAIPAVWLVGSTLLLLRLVIDHARLQHLRRSAEHADAITIGIGLETARRMNVPLPELLRSPLVASPCLCGLVRPAILLPEELDADALPAVLVHELAHRKRGDLLWNLLRHIAASLLWPQPLIWQLSRRLEAVAEDVCDDYVVALGGCPHSYAAALVAIAQRDLMPSEAAVSLVTFRSMLGQRVQRILDGSRGLSLTVGLAALVVIAAGGATAVLMAGLLGPGRSNTAVIADDNKTDEAQGDEKADAKELTDGVAADRKTADDDVVTVRGVVLDPEGKPVAGARVSVVRYYWHGQKLDTPLATTSTDSQGNYEISYRKSQFVKNLARPEMWREAAVVATHDGYGPGWTSYGDIQDGGTTTLRLVDDHPVEGRIVDLEGRPIPGVTVELESIYRHTQEDIAHWVDAMRRGVPFFGSEDYGRPNDSVPGFGLPIAGTLVTGQNGTFALRGIGKNRYAVLKIRSAQCAAAELRVVTMPIESFEADFGQEGYTNLLTFYGTKFSFSAEPSQPIEGIVRDAITKQPLPGVRVYADQLSGRTISGLYAAEAVSDTEGRYRIHGLPKGDGNGLLAVPNDEQPYFMRELRDIPTAEGLAPIQFDIELHRGIWITGRLSEKVNGAPVQAHLYYLPWPDNEAIKDLPEFNAGHLPGSHMRYESDADGRFKLVGLPGRGLVAANTLASFPFGQGVRAIKDLPPYDVFRKVAGVYAPTSTFPTAVYEIRPEGDSDVEIDFRIDPGSRIPVRFVDAAGEPASGLRVHGLHPKSKWHEDKDVGPEATLLALGSDETRLLLAHDEARSQGKAVLITPEHAKEKKLQIELEPCAKVKARLLDVDGQPMPGLVIRIWPVGEQDWTIELPSASTDDNGNLEAQLLPGVAYSIYAESAQISMQPLIKDLQIGAGETIDLGEFDVTSKERPAPKRTEVVVASSEAAANDPAAKDDVIVVRGVVLDPQGKPAAGAKLRAFSLERGNARGESAEFWKEISTGEVADASGQFAVELNAWQGRYALLVATAPGRGPAWKSVSRTKIGEELQLQLVEDHPIRARLVNLEGQPIANATIDVKTIESNVAEDLAPWLDALRSGMNPSVAQKLRGVQTELGFGTRNKLDGRTHVDIRETTDADGRATLERVGRGRLANVIISGPGIVTTRATIVTSPIEPIDVDFTGLSLPALQRFHGADCTLVVESSAPIQGFIRDAETGAPLAGVTVVSNKNAGSRRIQNYLSSAVSDANGRYRLDGMPSGLGNNVLAIPPRDLPYLLRDFDIPESRPLETVTYDLALHRGVFIEGRVLDAESKQPVYGQIHYLPWPDRPNLREYPEFNDRSLPGPDDFYHTDAEGHYRIVGLPGRGLIELSRISSSQQAYPIGQGVDQIPDLPSDEAFEPISQIYAPRSAAVTAIREVMAVEQAVTQADIELQRGDQIALRLIDPQGRPVSGARVRGVAPMGQQSASLNAGPDVNVAGLAPGEIRHVVVQQDELGLCKAITVSIASNGSGPVDVKLEPAATITARLLSDGEPLAHASVSVRHRTNPFFVERPVTTNEVGRFTYTNVPAAMAIDVFVDIPNGRTKFLVSNFEVNSGERIEFGDVELTSDKRPEPRRTAMVAAVANAGSQPTDSAQPLVVRGVVLDPDGKPLAGAKVKMTRAYSTNKWAKDAPKVEVVSGAEGRFEFDVPKLLSDGYRNGQPWPVSGVMVTAEGVAVTFVHLRDESAAANATVRMTPFAALTGRIVNLEGQPVPGVTVQLHQVNVTESGDLGPYLAALRARTPADEIDDATKPNMGFGHDAMRTANRATTDADGRFRLERVGRNHIAMLRLSGGGIVLTEIQVANVATEPVPFGDNSRQATEDMLYGSPFEFAVEPSPPIVGVVTDAETLKPIAGVTIGSTRFEEINKYGFGILETKTDELGRYRLEGVRPKPSRGELQRFVVRSTGDVPYLPQEFDAPEAGEDLAPIVYGIELHRGVWIEGRVTDAVTGKPISAKVEYLPWYDNPRVDRLPEYQGNGVIRLDPSMSPNTDEQGRYKLIGIPGRGIVQISHVEGESYPMGQGFDAIPDLAGAAKKFERLGRFNTPKPEQNVAIKELNIPEDATRVESNFELKPGTTVTLVAKDSNGKLVEVTEAFGLHPHHILRKHENPGEKIEVLGLSEREPRTIVLLNIERRLGAAVEINLKEDSAPDRSVTLLPLATITGRLVDASGEPLPAEDFERDREYIKLWSETHGRSMQVHATTPNDKGEFELLAAPGPIEYRVYASNARGDLAEKLRVEPGETIDLGTIDGTSEERPEPKRMAMVAANVNVDAPVDEDMAPNKSPPILVRGVVLDPESKPAAGINVRLIGSSQAAWPKPRMRIDQISGADGRFELALPPGVDDKDGKPWPVYGLIVTSDNYATDLFWYGKEKAGTEAAIKLKPPSPIEGRIVNLEGQPVAGVRVELRSLMVNRTGDLTAWIDALRKQTPPSEWEEGLAPNFGFGDAVDLTKYGTETDADGRFRLMGVGPHQVARLRIAGGRAVASQIQVANVAVEPIVTDDADSVLFGSTVFGSKFEFSAEPSQTVEGVVKDAKTGSPIPGIRVASWRFAGSNLVDNELAETVSDEYGHYRLEGMPGGEGNEIFARPTGDQPYLTRQFEVPAGRGLEPVKFDLELHRGVLVRGHVGDATTGQPLHGQVIYLPWPTNPGIEGLPEFTSRRLMGDSQRWNIDKEGRFTLVGLPGRGVLVITRIDSHDYPSGQGFDKLREPIEKGAFKEISQLYEPDAGHTPAILDLDIAEDAKEVAADFNLIAGDTVQLTAVDTQRKPIEITEGFGLLPGSWGSRKVVDGLTANVSGLRKEESRQVTLINLERGLGASLKVSLSDTTPRPPVQFEPVATVTGRLVSGDGEPMPRSNIDVRSIGESPAIVFNSVFTDRDGHFKLQLVAAGMPYRIRSINLREAIAESLTVSSGEAIDLGTINAAIKARPAVKRTPASMAVADATVDEGTATDVLEQAETANNKDSFTFTGTVLGPDGKPQAGAKVSLPYRVEKERRVARASTATDGTFTLEVPRKDYVFEKHSFATILVEAEGLGITWDYAAPFETTGEMIAALPEHHRYAEFVTKSKTRTLKLVDDHAVAGRIVNLEGQPIAGAKVVVNAVHANHAEGLGPWLASVQNHELGFQQAWRKLPDMFHPSSNDEDGTSPFGPVLTDADGRFRIVALGRDRLVSVNVSGPGIETRELYFRTQAGEVLDLADDASESDGERQTVYTGEFQNAAAPSLPLVGTVRDVDTGRPIAGVEITPESIAGVNLGGRPYRSMKAITDAEGRYRLEGLPIGENDIAAVPADDQPYPPVSLEVEMDSTKPETTLDFQLKRGVWIRGRVTDGDTGEPVVSRVQYLPFSDNDHVRAVPGLYRSIDWKRTEDDGSFQIIGLPGHGLLTQMVGNNYEKYPRGGGHEKVAGAKMGEHVKTFPYLSTPANCHYMAELNVDAAAAEVRHDMTLFAGGTRSGIVVDPQGQALAGAHCVGLKSAGFWDELPTNAFAVNHLKAGEKRRLTFFHEERNLAASIEISSDESAPITVTLQPAGTVTGLIRFQSGDLASRVELSGDRRSASPGLPLGPLPPGHPRLTSDDGRFTLKGLVPGLNYSVHASRSSYIIGNVFKDATVAAGETKDLGELTIPDPQN